MLRRILFTICFSSVFTARAFGQQAGQIVGVVTDGTGGVVAGVTVKTTEAGTGFARTNITGSDGQYVLPALRPTQYEVTAQAAGFRTFRRSDIELLANQSLTLNITLELGAVTETVNVAGAAVQVDTSTSTLSEVVDRSRIYRVAAQWARCGSTDHAGGGYRAYIGEPGKPGSRFPEGCVCLPTASAPGKSPTGWTG